VSCEQGAEEDIWTEEGLVDGRVEKLHNEELNDLCSLQSIMRIIKSQRMKWAGHVAGLGRRGTLLGYWCKSQKERDH
jgi:hypothetical protein